MPKGQRRIRTHSSFRVRVRQVRVRVRVRVRVVRVRASARGRVVNVTGRIPSVIHTRFDTMLELG